jgi:hypothetical protein
MLTATRLGIVVAAGVALSSCGDGGRDQPVEGRIPTEIPSGIEKALREVPPGLRSALQAEIACERARYPAVGRRFVLDAGTIRSLTERLRTHAPRCTRTGPPAPREDAPRTEAN